MLIILDSKEDRAKAFSQIAYAAYPNIPIYLRIFIDKPKNPEWIWEQYPTNQDNNNSLPLGVAQLVLIHHSDEDKISDIIPPAELEIWYGGGDRGLSEGRQLNIYYKFGSSQAVNNVLSVERFKELWKWATNDNRDNLALPFLLRHPTPEYLISLFILCQGYLANYQNSGLPKFTSLARELVDKVSIQDNQNTVNDIEQWWLKIFNKHPNWQEIIKKELKDFAYYNEQEKIIIEKFVCALSEGKIRVSQDLVYQVYDSITKILDNSKLI